MQILLGKQLLETFGPLMNVHAIENDIAVREGLAAQKRYEQVFQKKGREMIDSLVEEDKLGFVVLARPYHNDIGVNHEILLQLQRMGYSVLAQDSLPMDEEFGYSIFEDDIKSGLIQHPNEISDVWPTSYSENTSKKIWAAKFLARHPNLVALELSSFKCGHDAPPYTVVERIIAASKTPLFTFRDLDENSPGGAIKIRLETIHYFLKREVEILKKKGVFDKFKVKQKAAMARYHTDFKKLDTIST